MERVTGSKSLIVAAIVSLIIHGGIFLAYALVFKDAGAFNTGSEPLQVALILPAELGKQSPLPAVAAKKEKAGIGQEDPSEAKVPVDLAMYLDEAPSQSGREILAAKAGNEAGTLQAKDQGAGDAPPGPEIMATPALGGVAAYLPATGPSAGRAANSQGSPKVAASRGEMSTPGYAQLETFRGGASTFAAPRYSEHYLPVYPLPARQRGHAGVVMLSVEVLADGSVGRLEMKKTSGYDLLDKSARVTVKGWKFSPAKKMGTPVTMWVDVPVKFELN